MKQSSIIQDTRHTYKNLICSKYLDIDYTIDKIRTIKAYRRGIITKEEYKKDIKKYVDFNFCDLYLYNKHKQDIKQDTQTLNKKTHALFNNLVKTLDNPTKKQLKYLAMWCYINA